MKQALWIVGVWCSLLNLLLSAAACERSREVVGTGAAESGVCVCESACLCVCAALACVCFCLNLSALFVEWSSGARGDR